MKNIQKGQPPTDFQAWKAERLPKNWDDLQNEPAERLPGMAYFSKKELRKSLVDEQNQLCCYCQASIDFSEKTKIEHHFPKDGADKKRGKELMFDYQNLLAACDGGQRDKGKISPRQLHCDAAKQEKIIGLSPLEDCESRLHFVWIGNGKVEISALEPADLEAAAALKILKLNCPKIQNGWGSAVGGLIYEDLDGLVFISKEAAKTKLAEFETLENAMPTGELPEFWSIKKHFLRQLAGG